jgi:hypothetical protein
MLDSRRHDRGGVVQYFLGVYKMKAIGLCIATMGFLFTVTGEHWEYYAAIAAGLTIYAGAFYLGRQ